MRVYGAEMLWKQMNREGVTIARCTVERLMKRHGLQRVRRDKVISTTVSDGKAPCPPGTGSTGISRPRGPTSGGLC